MYRALPVAACSILALTLIGLHVLHFFPHSIYDILRTTPYRAPLLNCDMPQSKLVPGAYGVILRPGDSLADHKTSVQGTIDLDAHIRFVMDVGGWPSQPAYSAENVSDAALDAIRADTKVAFVECDGVATIPDNEF